VYKTTIAVSLSVDTGSDVLPVVAIEVVGEE